MCSSTVKRKRRKGKKEKQGREGGREKGREDREEVKPKSEVKEGPKPAAVQQIEMRQKVPERDSPGETGIEGAPDLFVHLKNSVQRS